MIIKTSLRQLGYDAALMLRLMMAGHLRWEPFSADSFKGELCIGGLRYTTHLECGQPYLYEELRRTLVRADELRRKRP